MSPALATPAAASPNMINTGFRLGDEHASDSDSDQSAASVRSISPERKGLPKSRKRKERKQFGALAHELGDIMGAAFTGPAVTPATHVASGMSANLMDS